MSSHAKRFFKVFLPITIAIIIVVTVVLTILFTNRVTAKDYFNAVNKQNYSKQIQTTKITENETLIYQKVETIIFDGNNVYHKIEEKQLSQDINKDFDETTTEYYYSKDKWYYFEDNVWKTENFTLTNKLLTYDLKTEYFQTINFNKKIETEGHLEGTIKNDSVEKIVSGLNLTEMDLMIIVNKNFDVLKFDINAKTLSNRDVEIKNVYSYDDETVVLPIA